MNDHHVKAREYGKKAWYFITPKFTLNRLRIHAATFTKEQAERVAAEWAKDAGLYEFKTAKIKTSNA
jgi:hypothetical protein